MDALIALAKVLGSAEALVTVDDIIRGGVTDPQDLRIAVAGRFVVNATRVGLSLGPLDVDELVAVARDIVEPF